MSPDGESSDIPADDEVIVVVSRQRDQVVVVARGVAHDPRLSFRARGVLVWMLDPPEGARLDRASIAAAGKEGRSAIETVFRELRDLGYMVRENRRGPDGRLRSTTYLFEVPGSPVPGNRAPVPIRRLPVPGNRAPENPAPVTGQPESESSETEAEKLSLVASDSDLVDPPTKMDHLPTAAAIRKGSAYPPSFEACWRQYPKREGGNSKIEAYKAWRTTVDRGKKSPGITPRIFWLDAATAAYYDHVADADKLETSYVLMASTFYGPGERWKDFATAARNQGVTFV